MEMSPRSTRHAVPAEFSGAAMAWVRPWTALCSLIAASLSKALSVPVDYHGVPAAVYRSFGFPGADDLGNMFQFKAEFEETYCGARDVSLCQALYPGLLSFDAWLAKYGGQIAVG